MAVMTDATLQQIKEQILRKNVAMREFVDMYGDTSWGGLPYTLDNVFKAIIDGTNTTTLFRRWWEAATYINSRASRYALLERWFGILADAWSGKTYTLRGPWWENNTTGATTLTPLDDLAGKTAAVCATEETADAFDWADEDPMTWYIRFNGLSLADGTMNVLAIEGVDESFDITGNTAPVYTGRLGLWKKHYRDGEYEYKQFRTIQADGYKPWAGDVAPDGTHRRMNWEATFGGSKTADGKLTSGSGYNGSSWERNGNVTAISMSASAGLPACRLWDAYEGTYSDTDLEPIIDLFQLRHFDMENSGIIEGCLNYSLDYTVAMAETGVRSVLVTAAQGANFLEGSFLDIGTASRGGQIARANLIRKEEVTLDGTAYCRLHLDLAADVDVPEGAHVATLPWTPGSTEHLPGHKDGSLGSCTNGKTPARIAGVEIIDGAYAVGLDPLWMSDYNAERDPKSIYTIHQCRDSEKQAGSITDDYEEAGTFTSGATGWQYEKHLAINSKGMIYPDALGAASTTFMKSAFSFSASSGVRCPWRFTSLDCGGFGGLAGAGGYVSPGAAAWAERPRLSGSGKKRGEWAA